eukprot:scaffold134_cov94-Amphora_coffeaeformis.AAC.16
MSLADWAKRCRLFSLASWMPTARKAAVRPPPRNKMTLDRSSIGDALFLYFILVEDDSIECFFDVRPTFKVRPCHVVDYLQRCSDMASSIKKSEELLYLSGVFSCQSKNKLRLRSEKRFAFPHKKYTMVDINRKNVEQPEGYWYGTPATCFSSDWYRI